MWTGVDTARTVAFSLLGLIISQSVQQVSLQIHCFYLSNAESHRILTSTTMQRFPTLFQDKLDEAHKESCLSRVSRKFDKLMQRLFYGLGSSVTSRPWLFILLPLAFTGLCLVGLVLNFQVENNGEKLYTPQSSQAWDDRFYVEGLYPSYRPVLIYAVQPNGENVLTKSTLLGFLGIYEQLLTVKGEYEGQTYGLAEVCERINGVCDVQSVLDFWNYNSTLIQNDPDILSTINQANATDRLGRPFRLETFIGGVTRAGSGAVQSATAFRLVARVEDVKEPVSNGPDDDPQSTAFEQQAAKDFNGITTSGLTTYVWSFYVQQSEYEKAIGDDLLLFAGGYLLLLLYGASVLGRPNRVASSAALAVASIASVGMAIITSFGICLTIGVKFSLVVNTLAFVLLGIGLDDTFVIVGAYRSLPEHLNSKERVSRALSYAGASITVTSITDFAAFLSGTMTIIPAINAFCIYAAVGVLFDFIYQITFFTAWLTLDVRRQEDKRLDCLCCVTATPPTDNRICSDDKFNNGDTGLMTHFMVKIYSRAVISRPGKAIVLLITLTLILFSTYGIMNLKPELNYEWFAPEDSFLQEVFIIRDTLFEGQNVEFSVYTKQGDYFANQAQLLSMQTTLSNDDYTLSGSLISWQQAHLLYVSQTSPSFLTSGLVNNETFFYSSLQSFLQGPGIAFKDLVIFDGTSQGIVSARFPARFRALTTMQSQLDAMERCRAIGAEGGMPGICYTFLMMFWEGEEVLVEETFRNVMIAGAAVFLVVLVLLAQVDTALLVFLMILLNDFFIVGFIHIVGLTFNAVVAINLILAVGLSVDYSAHIAHTFAAAKGSKNRRANTALSVMGPSVLNGGISTFLAIVMLAGATSYVFRVFFRMFSLIVVFGLFNGLALLPVLLSFIGPETHASLTLSTTHQIQPKRFLSLVEEELARNSSIEFSHLAQANTHTQTNSAMVNLPAYSTRAGSILSSSQQALIPEE